MKKIHTLTVENNKQNDKAHGAALQLVEAPSREWLTVSVLFSVI